MKKIIAFLILVMTFLSGAVLLWAITLPPVPPVITSANFYTCSTNYYVRTDGSDSNDGTANDSAHAWLTVTGATQGLMGTSPANLNRSGVCVNFADGTYVGDQAASASTPWNAGVYTTSSGRRLGLGGTAGVSNQLVFRSTNYHGAILHTSYTTGDSTNFHAIFSFGLLNQYTFTITSSSMVVNDTYNAPDGAVCTILSTTSSSTTVYASCNGVPDTVASGTNTLTRASGTGPAGPLTYSAVSGGWIGGNIVIDGFDMEGNGGIWWTTSAATTTTGDVYADQGNQQYTVQYGQTATASVFTNSIHNPVYTFTLSAPASTSIGTVYTNLNGSAVTISCTVAATIASSTTLLANCTGTPHNPNSTLVNAVTGNLTYTAASNTSGVLTKISGNPGSDATIAYTAKSGANDCGIVSAGSGLLPMAHLTAINNIANYFGSVGIGGNHYDYFTAEGNLITNSATIGSPQTSGMSIYDGFQTDSATGYHNNIIWNVLHDNATTPFISYQHTDGNNIILDDYKLAQNNCATSPSISITASGGAIQSGTVSGGTSCEIGDLISIVQSGAYGGTFIITAVSSGAATAMQLYTQGTGYTTASGLSSTQGYGLSEGQGGTMAVTINGSGGIATCISTGGTGYINGNTILVNEFTEAIGSSSANAGDTYTNNGNTYTVVNTIASATSVLLTSTTTSAPTGSNNQAVLTRATGSGSATMTASISSSVTGSSGECQVATNSSGVPSTWTVYNPGKGYVAASGLTLINLGDKYTLIQNNLVYNSGGAGIRVYSSDGAVVINNTNYNNNTDVLGNSTVGYSGGIMASVSNGDIFANNISYTIVGTGAQAGNTAYSNMGQSNGNLWFNNLSYNGTSGQNSFTQSGDLSGTTLTGGPYTNFLGTNPSFNSISTSDFTPGSAFPSQDAGTAVYGYPATDLVGTVLVSSTITLGAYQYAVPSQQQSTAAPYVIYN